MAELSKPADDFKLGILFVHGIGSQASGNTLVQWGDALLKTINQATRKDVKAVAHHAIKDDNGIAEMIVQIDDNGTDERWLITEGRWADSFLPPSYADLVSWSMRAIPWTLTLHIAQRFWQRTNNKRYVRKVFAGLLAVVELLVALILAPVSMFLLLISVLLGMLPFPQLRSLILMAQGTLVSTVGDSLAFVESPARAALIRTRLLERLHSLNTRCEKTIVVAHSQGAAVVLDALGGIPEPSLDDSRQYFKELPSGLEMPDTLITFGAGTNQLASLKVLASGPFLKLGMNPAIFALVGFISAFLIFFYLILTGVPPKILFYASAFVIPGFIMLMLLKYPARMFRWLYSKVKVVKNPNSLALYTVGPIVPILYVVAFFTMNVSQWPIGWILVFFVCIIILVYSIISILSSRVRSMISISRMPPGLGTWIDIHSSADPVANGPTNISEGSAKPSSWKVWNFGALLYDHTGYWQNVDGFVLRIARICAQTAESKWINALPQNQDKIDKRSEFRTQWLHRIGRFLLVMWVVIGISLWIQHKEAIPHLLPLPEWIKFQSDNLIRFLVLLGFLFVSMWLTYNVARLIWMFWVRKEQNIFLAHQIPADFQSVPVVGMIMIVGLVIVFAFILITKTTAEIRAIQVTVEDMKVYLAMLITFSAFMYYIFFHSGKEFKRKLEEIDSSVKPN